MALSGVSVAHRFQKHNKPERKKEDHHDYGKDFDSPCVGFLVNLHEAVQECRKPEEPFQKGC
jgi:hypothetical protein